MRKCVIVGAGFRGFCDALQLLKNPDNEIYIIDKAPHFGGISWSSDILGFAVDKGVHMFDGIPQSLADILAEVMGGKLRAVEHVSSSVFNGIVTEGFSLPDLSSCPLYQLKNMEAELKFLAAAGPRHEFNSLLELFWGRYGGTACSIFSALFQRIYNLPPSQAQADAISRTSMGRLKFGSDEEMLALKQSDPWLDNVLAARRQALGKVDDLVSVYPDTGEGMRGWCKAAAAWLQRKGVHLCLGENIVLIQPEKGVTSVITNKQKIDADLVLWTNDSTAQLADALQFDYDTLHLLSPTPMYFTTLITQAKHIKNFTYLQNFDLHAIAYRTAAAGIYSGQVNDKEESFITCECPVTSKRASVDDLWSECKKYGVVDENATRVASHTQYVPSTFKIPKLGYDEAITDFRCAIAPRVIFRNPKPFFRREIYLDSLELDV